MLEIRNLTAAYGSVEALRNLSFTVSEGQTVALLGRNGAGKTTTLRAISRLMHPKQGEILFDGTRIDRWRPEAVARAGIAHVPEGRELFGGLSVMDNIVTGAYFRRLRRKSLAEEVERVLEFFPVLRPFLDEPAGTLSGGQRQMLALARGLVGRPRLLMIDEPSLGLSPIATEQLYESFATLRKEAEGLTVLLVEQYVALALEAVDRAYVLEKGEVVLDGDAHELHDHPEVIAAYVG
ncbi:MAG: ABC transporter ATP-binding protein [Acidimicrobiia bacterium]